MPGKLKTGIELEELGVRNSARKADDLWAFCIVMEKERLSVSPRRS